MKYIKRFITLPAVASAILFGCITEFEPKGIEEVSDLIVIDGTITDGETRVTLRYSVGLTENLTGSEYLYGADVYVETDGGETFPAYYEMTPSVTYVIPNGDLDANKQYRLNVVYGGKHYQSSFLAPMVTPAIDSISAQKAGTGQPVYMCVNTHDPANRSNY